MSHRRRGGPTGHAKNLQSSLDILVEERVIDFKEESDSSKTLTDQYALIPYFIQALQTPARKN